MKKWAYLYSLFLFSNVFVIQANSILHDLEDFNKKIQKIDYGLLHTCQKIDAYKNNIPDDIEYSIEAQDYLDEMEQEKQNIKFFIKSKISTCSYMINQLFSRVDDYKKAGNFDREQCIIFKQAKSIMLENLRSLWKYRTLGKEGKLIALIQQFNKYLLTIRTL